MVQNALIPAARGQIVTLPTETCRGAEQIHAIRDATSEVSIIRSRSGESGPIARPDEFMLWGWTSDTRMPWGLRSSAADSSKPRRPHLLAE